MSQKEDKFENRSVTAETGVEIKEFLFLENGFPRGDVEQGESEVFAQAGEILGVRGKLGLAASTRHWYVRNAGLFLMINIPGFNAKAGTEKYNLTRIRRKLSGLSVHRINAKYKLQGITSEDVNSAFVLRQEVFAVRTKTKILDVAAQRVSQLLSRNDPGKVLGVANTLIMEHRRLPFVEIVRLDCRFRIHATGRQSRHIFQRFSKPFGIRRRSSEKVAEPVAGLAFRLHQAIHEIRETLWRIPSAGDRLDTELVRDLLVFFFLPRGRTVHLFQPHTFHELVVEPEKVFVGGQALDSQHIPKRARHVQSLLARGQVPELVAEDARQLIFIAQKSRHFA